jgi:hypothetical protein
MQTSDAEKQRRRDYRDRLWRNTPNPKLFPFPRLAVTLIISGAQFGSSMLRYKWNHDSPKPQVGKDVVIFAAVTIGIYMATYILEWSWNCVVLSPMILDGKNQAKLKQQAEDIASLNEKLVASSQRQSEIKLRLATFMEREVEIRERLEQSDAELARLVAESDDWVRETIAVLKDSGEFTDAVEFSQVGKLPQSNEQAQQWRHIPDEPRRRQLIRLAMYRKKLDQIRDNRRL